MVITRTVITVGIILAITGHTRTTAIIQARDITVGIGTTATIGTITTIRGKLS